jgi:hypothetical protein
MQALETLTIAAEGKQRQEECCGNISRASAGVHDFSVRHNRNPMKSALHRTEDSSLRTFKQQGSTTLFLFPLLYIKVHSFISLLS